MASGSADIVTDKESLQHAIHEEVALRVWNPQWPGIFAAERDRLLGLFPQMVAVEHIGSTAVEGMSAKPIIDVMAGVTSMHEAKSLAVPLCQSGYTTSSEFNASLTDRQWFMRWANGHRTHHLHGVVHEGAVWQKRLKFRDALRGNAELAAQSLQLKQRVASDHAQDRDAYTAAKTAFVHSVVAM
jgi:GrpB-like predicted nucleotidyltransferase (UPF0157 family)